MPAQRTQQVLDLMQRLMHNRRAGRIFRWVLGLAALVGLYIEISYKDQLGVIWSEFVAHIHGANWLVLAAVLTLMPINWLAETEKWYQFVRHYESIPRYKAFLAVLTGVSFSLFTPNRVGEYGGRMLYISAENQWRAVVANLVGNFAQFMVLLGTGILGATYILWRFDIVEPWQGKLFVGGALAGLLFMVLIFFNMNAVVDKTRRFRRLEPFRVVGRHFNLGVLRQFSRRELLDILRWAAFRYLVYCTQYYLLLRFFGIEADIIGGFAGIAGLFLLQTSIPLPPLTGLAARGNLAVLLWAQFGANEMSSLAATFSLWVINLVLPALIGTFALLYVNTGKTDSTDEIPHSDSAHEATVSISDPAPALVDQ